jgi:hypothetical protein
MLSRTALNPVWIIVSLHHQATWSVSLRQVLDIVQGLYRLAPEVVTSRNSRDGSQGVTYNSFTGAGLNLFNID